MDLQLPVQAGQDLISPLFVMAFLRLGLWCLSLFQQYVSFIGGGNWSTRRKPPTCRRLQPVNQSLTKNNKTPPHFTSKHLCNLTSFELSPIYL
jgi:hypothetical protein